MRKGRIESEAEFPMPAIAVLEGVEPKTVRVNTQVRAYCPLCTRTVDAMATVGRNIVYSKTYLHVVPGQKCPRCSSPLDAAFVLGPNNQTHLTN